MKVFALVIIFLLAVAYGLYWRNHSPDTLTAYGSIEARNIKLGSKVGGRVVAVTVEEGDEVQAQQTLVVFDDTELSAKVMQARGQLEQAEASLTKLKKGSRPEEIAEAEAAVSANQQHGFRVAELAQVKADLQRAKIESTNAEQAYRRADELIKQKFVAPQFRDDAFARWQTAQALVNSLEHAVEAAKSRITAAQAVATKTKQGFRVEEITAAEAEVKHAQGVLQEAQARYLEHKITAPSLAVVEVLDLQPGDLINPNTIIVKLLAPDQLFIMVYIPETEIGRVKLGQSASLKIDGFPSTTFPAKVVQIRQQAEFLPRNVQTIDERVHQMIGVKLRIENTDKKLRAGMTAQAIFVE